MKNNFKTILSFLAVTFLLSACANVSIQAQVAPKSTLKKSDSVYLVPLKKPTISHQKYMAALNSVLDQEGFNRVSKRSNAKYIMKTVFNDFLATLNQNIPTVETTHHQGIIGNTGISGTSTTYGNETVGRQIPTHNSSIIVSSKNTGQQIWQVQMAKSFETYNHSDLRLMISKMLSLYGQDGKTSQMVNDELRW